MLNVSNRIQQGCQETGASQSQESQDERLDGGALKQEVDIKAFTFNHYFKKSVSPSSVFYL